MKVAEEREATDALLEIVEELLLVVDCSMANFAAAVAFTVGLERKWGFARGTTQEAFEKHGNANASKAGDCGSCSSDIPDIRSESKDLKLCEIDGLSVPVDVLDPEGMQCVLVAELTGIEEEEAGNLAARPEAAESLGHQAIVDDERPLCSQRVLCPKHLDLGPEELVVYACTSAQGEH